MTIVDQLKEISTAVMFAAEAGDLEAVLQRIADVARELVKTDYAALGMPDGQGGLRFFKTSGMTAEQEARIPHRPIGHGLIGAIMRERKVIRLEDMQQDGRSSGFPENHPQMTSFLGAPIVVANHLYGMLYLSDKTDGSAFTTEDEHLLETLTGYAALAIAGAQLSESESRLKLMEQREGIGMELHDGVIQSLYGIGMQVDFMRRSHEPVEEKQLTELVNSLNDVIEDIRGFIGKLRATKNALTINECLIRLRDRLHPPETIHIMIDAPDSYAPFSPSVFESVCLIVNEAMSNAIRHANASQVHINAQIQEGNFEVRVSDNGKGFDRALLNTSDGLGLKNMQQRARLHGGNVVVLTEENKGTTLDIIIPIGSY